MATEAVHTPTPRRRAALALAALLVLLVAVAALSAPADATRAKRLGQTKHTPAPERDRVEGRVTGFQVVADGKRGLFKAPKNGKVVAWAVNLSKPPKDIQDFFRSIFFAGNRDEPYARVAVLAHVRGGRFRLLRQSPKVKLRHEMGEKPVITLNHPLRMRKGQILALTINTWLPAFAKIGPGEHGEFGTNKENQWRGSRSSDNCEPASDTFQAKKRFAQNSRPHKKPGTTRRYGCKYRGGRLLYWGYFVPE